MAQGVTGADGSPRVQPSFRFRCLRLHPRPHVEPLLDESAGQERADSTRYNSSWYETAAKAKLRGVRFFFGYVGDDFSSLVGKSTNTIVSHLLKACLADFTAVRRSGQKLSERLEAGGKATVTTQRSTLEFSVTGAPEIRRWNRQTSTTFHTRTT